MTAWIAGVLIMLGLIVMTLGVYGEMFPELRAALSAEQLADIGQKLADGKAEAPTRPHPHAPASRPGAKVAGPAPAWWTGPATRWATAPPTRTPSLG